MYTSTRCEAHRVRRAALGEAQADPSQHAASGVDLWAERFYSGGNFVLPKTRGYERLWTPSISMEKPLWCWAWRIAGPLPTLLRKRYKNTACAWRSRTRTSALGQRSASSPATGPTSSISPANSRMIPRSMRPLRRSRRNLDSSTTSSTALPLPTALSYRVSSARFRAVGSKRLWTSVPIPSSPWPSGLPHSCQLTRAVCLP